MKKSIFFLALLLFSTTLFSQANKPQVGDFGIRTGIYFLGNQGTGITFSKMLKKNLESGIALNFTFNGSKHNSIDTVTIFITTNKISAKQENSNSSFGYNINLTPFLSYHFPLKNNFDVYAGGWATVFAGNTPISKNQQHIYADNYSQSRTTTTYSPFTFGTGAGLLFGADYFFHKNISVGLSGTFGFVTSFQYGKEITKVISENSGSLNTQQTNASTERARTIKNIDGNIALHGGVGITLNFFFTRGEKKKAAEKI